MQAVTAHVCVQADMVLVGGRVQGQVWNGARLWRIRLEAPVTPSMELIVDLWKDWGKRVAVSAQSWEPRYDLELVHCHCLA